jgi:hypothetical protein
MRLSWAMETPASFFLILGNKKKAPPASSGEKGVFLHHLDGILG